MNTAMQIFVGVNACIAYFVIGWCIAKHQLSKFWKDSMDKYKHESAARQDVQFWFMLTMAAWFIILIHRGMYKLDGIIMRDPIESANPVAAKRREKEQAKRIAELEAELDIASEYVETGEPKVRCYTCGNWSVQGRDCC